jgi:PAS domain S-box-containing protein
MGFNIYDINRTVVARWHLANRVKGIAFNRNSVKNNLNKLSQALKNKQEYKFESHNVRKNGEQYWLNITLLPISNIEGEHSHWISIQREITLEKEREKILH